MFHNLPRGVLQGALNQQSYLSMQFRTIYCGIFCYSLEAVMFLSTTIFCLFLT